MIKPLAVGDPVPEFSLKDQNGNMFDIKTILGRKNIVIFFYPQDGTYNCTRQVCYFRDFADAFDETESVIIGISGQSVKSHKEFAEKNNIRYPMLSDDGDHVRRLFGIPPKLFGFLPGRVTYVVDKKGKIVHIFSSQSQVERHVDEALKVSLILKKTEDSEYKKI